MTFVETTVGIFFLINRFISGVDLVGIHECERHDIFNQPFRLPSVDKIRQTSRGKQLIEREIESAKAILK